MQPIQQAKAAIPGEFRIEARAGMRGRYFDAERPKQKWVLGITRLQTLTGWVHLAVVIELRPLPQERNLVASNEVSV